MEVGQTLWVAHVAIDSLQQTVHVRPHTVLSFDDRQVVSRSNSTGSLQVNENWRPNFECMHPTREAAMRECARWLRARAAEVLAEADRCERDCQGQPQEATP